MPDQLSYADARTFQAASFLNLNNGLTYTTSGGDVSEDAESQKVMNDYGAHVGSYVAGAGFSGSVTLTYKSAAHAVIGAAQLVRAGHVGQWDSSYWAIGAVKSQKKLNDIVRASCSLVRVENPIVDSLLSAEGQVTRISSTTAAALNKTNTVKNTRSGASLVWALEAGNTAVPAGAAINASTGAITGTVAVAGTYDFLVTCTDSLAGHDDRVGFGRIILTVA